MDSDDENTAMQEMMGFSTFGNNKRQKLNPGAVSNLPPKAPTTASNSTPLGKRANKNTSSHLNMVPASLPPSGRASASPPPNIARLNATKLSEPVESDQQDVPRSEAEPTTDRLPSHPKAANTSTSFPHTSIEASTAQDSLTIPPNQTSLPPKPLTTAHYSTNDIRSDPSYWTNASAPRQQVQQKVDNEVAYTSPWTGVTMTKKKLREYGTGKEEVQVNGSTVTVFFKPGFVATQEELWGRWLGKKEESAGE